MAIRQAELPRVVPNVIPKTVVTPDVTGVEPAQQAKPSKPTAVADVRDDAPVGQTADKVVADALPAAQVGANAQATQQAIADSHRGVAVGKHELKASHRLAKQLVTDVVSTTWDKKATPELQAIKEAIGPHLSAMAKETGARLLSDPAAAANLSTVVAKLGKEGFQAALSSSSKDVAGHFLKAAGIEATNPAVIRAALNGIEAIAPSLGTTLGPKVAGTAAKLAPRLLGEAAGKGAVVAGKATGQALPLVGNIISVGTTLVAGANLISQIGKKPRDGEKIAKEGINTLTQMVGIAFPWVALGGTLTDAAWSAKIGVTDGKRAVAGEDITASADVKASLPLLSDSAELLQAALQGAGHGDAAKHVGKLSSTVTTLASDEHQDPAKRLSMLRHDEQSAFLATANAAHSGLEELLKDEPPSPRRQALVQLAGSFGAFANVMMATMGFDKRADKGLTEQGRKDLQTKRNDLASTLVQQLSELGVAELSAKS
jgi:hypothetical protein